MSLLVELISQDKSNACWLASSTMMRSWKDSKSYPISDTLMLLDGQWGSFSNIYNADSGLPFSDNQKMVQTLGLTALSPASYKIEFFFSILDVSPVMAVIMFAPGSTVAHMIVITGITGDSTPEGTVLQVNDPLPINAGHTYSISFADFLQKFESVVAFENGFPGSDLTSQLFYFASADTSNTSNAGESTESTETTSDADTTGSTDATTEANTAESSGAPETTDATESADVPETTDTSSTGEEPVQ